MLCLAVCSCWRGCRRKQQQRRDSDHLPRCTREGSTSTFPPAAVSYYNDYDRKLAQRTSTDQPPPMATEGVFIAPSSSGEHVVVAAAVPSDIGSNATLDPMQAISWQRRRAAIQRSLSAESAGGDAGVCVLRGASTPGFKLASSDLPGVAEAVALAAASAGDRPGLLWPNCGHVPAGMGASMLSPHEIDLKIRTDVSRAVSGGRKPSPPSAKTTDGRRLIFSPGERRSKQHIVHVDAPVAHASPTATALNPQAEKICAEVRQTEAAYLTDLSIALSVYVRPAIGEHMLTPEDAQAIFINLEELYRCASILSELMERPGESVVVLASAFIKVTPFFKLYAFYCRSCERSLATLARCRLAVPGFNEFLLRQQALPECRGLQLESCLIKPVQRLTEYPLLWKAVLKNTARSHPERALLEKADELVRTVSMVVNQKLKDEVAYLKAVEEASPTGSRWLC